VVPNRATGAFAPWLFAASSGSHATISVAFVFNLIGAQGFYPDAKERLFSEANRNAF
jgi:hypothetical protein